MAAAALEDGAVATCCNDDGENNNDDDLDKDDLDKDDLDDLNFLLWLLNFVLELAANSLLYWSVSLLAFKIMPASTSLGVMFPPLNKCSSSELICLYEFS